MALSSTRSSGEENGTYPIGAPRNLANSRMPWTELWLSCVKTSWDRGPNGYASPTSRHAAVALGVKMATYSSGGALKCARTASRARSTWVLSCACAGRPAPA